MHSNQVNNGTVTNLISLTLLLAHDKKYMYGNLVNNGTVINIIFGDLTLSP